VAQIRYDLSTGSRLYFEVQPGEGVISTLRAALGAGFVHYAPQEGRGVWWVTRKYQDIVAMSCQQIPQEAVSRSVPVLLDTNDPHNLTLEGEVTYGGREFWAAATSRDGSWVRVVSFPDGDSDGLYPFETWWVPAAAVEWQKKYKPFRPNGLRVTLGMRMDLFLAGGDDRCRWARCETCLAWGPLETTCVHCRTGGGHRLGLAGRPLAGQGRAPAGTGVRA
jgi:hypothetical protein